MHLLAAVESLIFFPSREAKCCSKASRRLLGACKERHGTDLKNLRQSKSEVKRLSKNATVGQLVQQLRILTPHLGILYIFNYLKYQMTDSLH